MTEAIYNVIIIGSGSGGLTAAIYTGRADLDPLLIEGSLPGGQLSTTTEVENYPGFSKGIQGPDLMDEMRKQAERFGTKVVFGDVQRVNLMKRPFEIHTDKNVYLSKTIIISTGASAKLLGLEAEKKYMGRGVSTCATCDGSFYRGKEIIVVGGGDSAMEEATFLTKFAKKVYLVHRRKTFRASKIMQDRALSNPKIEIIYNHIVEDILGNEEGVTGIRLKDVESGKKSELNIDGVFLAIGHTPNSKLFAGQIDLDEKGYIVTKSKTAETNIPGVFACGDVQDHRYRQAVTAAGTGCMAALDAEKYLENS